MQRGMMAAASAAAMRLAENGARRHQACPQCDVLVLACRTYVARATGAVIGNADLSSQEQRLTQGVLFGVSRSVRGRWGTQTSGRGSESI
jgi:hypothetical protein